jgi:hypothetical protein
MTRTFLLLALLPFSLSLPAQSGEQAQRANHYFDHLVVAINDLDRGVKEVERITGVLPKYDGSDAQLGTHSAVIGLGDNAFLEIIAPDPKADPGRVDAELKPLILDRLNTFESLTPFGWAIGTSNLERTRAFARQSSTRTSEAMPGSRKRSWGRQTRWEWSRVIRPESYVMPQFVQWDADTSPPQDRAPKGCALSNLKVYSRTYKSVHALIATMQVDVESAGAEEESISFSLDCPRGEVVVEGISLMGPSGPPEAKPR